VAVVFTDDFCRGGSLIEQRFQIAHHRFHPLIHRLRNILSSHGSASRHDSTAKG
jgi:hypothetical protein